MYKRLLADGGFGKRYLILARRRVFRGRARCVLKVLAYLLDHGEDEALHRTIDEPQVHRIKAKSGIAAAGAAVKALVQPAPVGVLQAQAHRRAPFSWTARRRETPPKGGAVVAAALSYGPLCALRAIRSRSRRISRASCEADLSCGRTAERERRPG